MSGASGVRVATRVVALSATLDAIGVVPCLRVKFAVAAAVVGNPVTVSLKVAVSGVRAVVLPRAMPVAPVAGLVAVTVGRGPVMNVQDWAARAPPEALLIVAVSDSV